MSEAISIIGHRGWPARFPDNTLAGFIAAAGIVDGFELDVRRSVDGKLVLSHDSVLAGLVVAESRWSVLAEMNLGAGHKPALLDEVLSSVPDLPFLIEVKNHPFEPGFEEDHRLALEAADRARAGDALVSFNWETALAVRKTYPEMRTGIAITRFQDLRSAIEHCLDVGHSLLVPEQHLIGGSWSEIANGLQVFPWTVDDAVRARELAGLGVTGIITNAPDEISTNAEM